MDNLLKKLECKKRVTGELKDLPLPVLIGRDYGLSEAIELIKKEKTEHEKSN